MKSFSVSLLLIGTWGLLVVTAEGKADFEPYLNDIRHLNGTGPKAVAPTDANTLKMLGNETGSTALLGYYVGVNFAEIKRQAAELMREKDPEFKKFEGAYKIIGYIENDEPGDYFVRIAYDSNSIFHIKVHVDESDEAATPKRKYRLLGVVGPKGRFEEIKQADFDEL